MMGATNPADSAPGRSAATSPPCSPRTSCTARTRPRARGASSGCSSRTGSCSPPSMRLVLASTSPQRRDILAAAADPVRRRRPRVRGARSPRRRPRGAGALACGRQGALGAPAGPARPSASTRPCTSTVASTASRGTWTTPWRCSGSSPGRTHTVLSGLCLIAPGGETVDHAETLVTFRSFGDRAIRDYVGSGEWRGRAGGYAIQGLGGRFVERIEGDYANVVGLPAALLLTTLERELPDVLVP